MFLFAIVILIDMGAWILDGYIIKSTPYFEDPVSIPYFDSAFEVYGLDKNGNGANGEVCNDVWDCSVTMCKAYAHINITKVITYPNYRKNYNDKCTYISIPKLWIKSLHTNNFLGALSIFWLIAVSLNILQMWLCCEQITFNIIYFCLTKSVSILTAALFVAWLVMERMHDNYSANILYIISILIWIIVQLVEMIMFKKLN